MKAGATDPESPLEKVERQRQRRDMLVQMTALGLEFSGSVLGGLALGYYLDHWLGTSPWMVLLMTLGGMAMAFARLVTLTRRFDALRRPSDDRT